MTPIGSNLLTPRRQVKKECVDFLSYLSASDGTISDYEADFLATYLGRRTNAERLRAYIEENHTYTVEFETTVPPTLRRLLDQDNAAYHGANALSQSASEAYITVFEAMGKEFLACDGETTEQEIADFSTYIGTLRTFKNENAASWPRSTTPWASSPKAPSWKSTAPAWSPATSAKPPSKSRKSSIKP